MTHAIVQLEASPERAGQSLLTLDFDDLEGELAAMRERGLETSPLGDTTSDEVLIATATDPDGNAITLVQQRWTSELTRLASRWAMRSSAAPGRRG